MKIIAGIFACAVACLAGPIGSPDTSCNPSVDPPSAGGCTWYNFYANTDNSITQGSSFSGYYTVSPDVPWTFTSALTTIFRVLDGGHQGDMFTVYDTINNVQTLVGTTSLTSIDADHACANDPTGPGTDPAACWNDPLMSRGSFLLAPGTHSLTVDWVQRVPGGDSKLQWFELEVAPTTVPDPASVGLVGSGLLLAGLLRRRRKGVR
jgi:hypothetical protein